MTIYYEDSTITIHAGDCLDVLKSLPDSSVDSVCTDPPYSLTFMGRAWDAHPSPLHFQQWCQIWAAECLRVLKPGGHMLAFGGTRTSHRLACAIEDAGFEIRDSIAWLYGSGFPKSLDVSKAIDKAAGAEREKVRHKPRAATSGTMSGSMDTRPWIEASRVTGYHEVDGDNPATDDARTWQGWGTALKPAHEPIVVARKPLTGTVAANVLLHGTGALNVDGCRVEGDEDGSRNRPPFCLGSESTYSQDEWTRTAVVQRQDTTGKGRWPSNVCLDESQAAVLDAMSGELTSGKMFAGTRPKGERETYGQDAASGYETAQDTPGDTGGASRFFYVARHDACHNGHPFEPGVSIDHAPGESDQRWCNVCGEARRSALPINQLDARFAYTAKADAGERVRIDGIAHPTVKPLSLMRWLVRLVTPPGGTVLEPFAGSGTTVEACILEGFKCIAIERETDYLPLIVQRIQRRRDPVAAVKASGEDEGLFGLLEGGVA